MTPPLATAVPCLGVHQRPGSLEQHQRSHPKELPKWKARWPAPPDGAKLWLFEDMRGTFSGVGTALIEFESENGLDWTPADPVLITKPQIQWVKGQNPSAIARLERPQLCIEEGKPLVLYVAAKDRSGHSYNIPIPLKE